MEDITQEPNPELFKVDNFARQPVVCGGTGGRTSLSTTCRCGGDRSLIPSVTSRREADRRQYWMVRTIAAKSSVQQALTLRSGAYGRDRPNVRSHFFSVGDAMKITPLDVLNVSGG